MRNIQNLVEKLEGKRLLEGTRRRWDNGTNIYFRELLWDVAGWTYLACDRAGVSTEINLYFP
jgi:hypothetical protein